jgi:hypothetical protein
MIELNGNNFPTLVVDDFFDDPQRVEDLAYSLEYHPTTGDWPGVRSKPLHEVAPEFFQYAGNRWMSLYFDYGNSELRWDIEAYFQIIEPFDKEHDSEYNQGWVHQDAHATCTSITYLSKNPTAEQGTSICSPIKEYNSLQQIRKKFYDGGERSVEYEEEIRKNQESFTETVVVDNVYNRIVSFDSKSWHKARSFHNESDAGRLTLVMFCHNIESSSPPPLVRKQMVTWS